LEILVYLEKYNLEEQDGTNSPSLDGFIGTTMTTIDRCVCTIPPLVIAFTSSAKVSAVASGLI
jgi:hypothetical protein